MTHQPPVPEGNQSPYPLHEAPHAHGGEPPAGAAVARTPAPAPEKRDARPYLLGGLLAAGVAAVAAVGAWAYATEPKYKRKERNRKRKAR